MRPLQRPLGQGLAVLLLLLPASVAGGARLGSETAAVTSSALVARPLAGPKADVAALLLAGRDSGSLWAAAVAVGRCDSRVDFWIEVAGSRLLAEEAAESPTSEILRLELYAYAINAAGELAGSLSRAARLPVAELDAELLAGGVKLAGQLQLPPGEYQLRLLVRETRTQQFALRLLSVRVPEREAGRAFLAGPAFPDSDGAWIMVREAPGPGARPAPLPADRRPAASPAAWPVLTAGSEHHLWLEGCDLDPAELTARLLDRDGQPVAELELLPPLEGAGPGRIETRLQLPELATGNYSLEVAMSGHPGSPAAALPVLVVAPEWSAPSASWVTLQRLVSEPERQREALELAQRRRGAQRIAANAAAYREILEQLAMGQRQVALERLEQLYGQLLSAKENRIRARDWLLTGQERVIAALAREDSECLLPLLALHLERHERFLESGVADPILLGASRDHILLLARTYADSSKTDLAPILAATALAELAVYLERAKDRMAARRALEEALILDERNQAALLDLALLHERAGRNQEALDSLEKLLEMQPSSGEGRLRLALNLSRLGRSAEAARLLRQVIAEGSTDWVSTVAYGELGRLLVRQERYEEAARVLEQGIARLPAEQRLYVQLAYVYDRDGRRHLGLEVLDRMPAAAGRASPRLLYSRRPRAASRDTHALLLRHAIGRLPLLGESLAKVGASR